MPELPEVNTVAAALQHFFAGETLAGWQSLTPRLRRPIPDRDQVKDLFGAELGQVVRIAKSIYFDFASELALHIHLGMTGFFSMPGKSAKPEKHEHLRLEFTSGKILAFSDPRRFGVVELAQLPLKRVPEPLAGALDAEYLAAACKGSGRTIKSLIMDQQIIAGAGNIYASEALFGAGIRPDRTAGSLAWHEIKALNASLIRVIETAIASGLDYQRKHGWFLNSETTHFPIETRVYGRAGELCEKCGRSSVENIRIAGRSSFFCPVCQKV
jgi:formamidopyrimidine-DNA glycosylase